METLEDLKAIIDGAPDGATHVQEVDGESQYFESNGFGFWCFNSGCQVLSEDVICVRSLSDIERIIELMEWQIEANKNYQSMLEAYLND